MFQTVFRECISDIQSHHFSGKQHTLFVESQDRLIHDHDHTTNPQ